MSVEECGANKLPFLVAAKDEVVELSNAWANRAAIRDTATSHWRSVGYVNQKPARVTVEHTCKLNLYMGGKSSNRKPGSVDKRWQGAVEREKRTGGTWLKKGMK